MGTPLMVVNFRSVASDFVIPTPILLYRCGRDPTLHRGSRRGTLVEAEAQQRAPENEIVRIRTLLIPDREHHLRRDIRILGSQSLAQTRILRHKAQHILRAAAVERVQMIVAGDRTTRAGQRLGSGPAASPRFAIGGTPRRWRPPRSHDIR